MTFTSLLPLLRARIDDDTDTYTERHIAAASQTETWLSRAPTSEPTVTRNDVALSIEWYSGAPLVVYHTALSLNDVVEVGYTQYQLSDRRLKRMLQLAALTMEAANMGPYTIVEAGDVPSTIVVTSLSAEPSVTEQHLMREIVRIMLTDPRYRSERTISATKTVGPLGATQQKQIDDLILSVQLNDAGILGALELWYAEDVTTVVLRTEDEA